VHGAAALVIALVLGGALFASCPARADDGFARFVSGLRPEALALGVSEATFDAAFAGLAPDLSLPDLRVPGRPTAKGRGQAEFVKPPQDYLKTSYLARLAVRGRVLRERHAATLARIEREIGVDRAALLAIWGRETAYGGYKPKHDAIRALATQAYVGRRKDFFRGELLSALRLLQDGMPRAKMRASWAGAMGLTQFLPSEVVKHGTDMDGDGKVDLFDSVPDALASAARQLKAKGWVLGLAWGYEVVLPAAERCALEGPPRRRTIAEWQRLGFKRVAGRTFPSATDAVEAYLMQPAGAYGPAFLVTENYRVIRRYNMSDLYAVFVGNLADRIAGGGDFVTPWSDPRQLATRDIEAVQRHLQESGHAAIDKVDGKIGSATRAEIGAYQIAAGITVDCWPTSGLLKHMRSVAR